MNPADAPPLDTLLGCLAEEQDALEWLLFKLKEQHLVLTCGEHRWLAPSSSEVVAALDALNAFSRRREEVASAVNAALGLAAGADLGQVADRVEDEGTCQAIHQRRAMLRDLLSQVRRCARRNGELLAHGLAATNDALSLLGVNPTYDSRGAASTSVSGQPFRLNTRV